MRPGGELVDEQAAGGREEELDGQHADGPERLRRSRAASSRASCETIGPTGAGMTVGSRMCRSCRFRPTG